MIYKGGIHIEDIHKIKKSEQEFFLNKHDKIEYYSECNSCARLCKQSHKIKDLMCNNQIKCHTPLQYEEKMDNDKRGFNEICKKLGINSRSLRSAMRNNRDMESEWYVKLEKELYGKTIKIS